MTVSERRRDLVISFEEKKARLTFFSPGSSSSLVYLLLLETRRIIASIHYNNTQRTTDLVCESGDRDRDGERKRGRKERERDKGSCRPNMHMSERHRRVPYPPVACFHQCVSLFSLLFLSPPLFFFCISPLRPLLHTVCRSSCSI